MNFFSEVANRGVSLESLLKFTDLDRRVQKHVQKVYATLAGAIVVCALGVYTYTLVPVNGFAPTLLGLGCLLGLMMTPSTPDTLGKRYAFLTGFSFLEGIGIAPLVTSVMQVYPSVVLTAFLMTVALFGSFSAAALCAQRRSMLYLGGLCSSGVWALLLIQFGGYFFEKSVWMFKAELYLGLIIFAGYILFDTQMIVERAGAGEMDPLKDALVFLLDFINIFIRILVILAQKQNEDERSGRSKKRNK